MYMNKESVFNENNKINQGNRRPYQPQEVYHTECDRTGYCLSLRAIIFSTAALGNITTKIRVQIHDLWWNHVNVYIEVDFVVTTMNQQ